MNRVPVEGQVRGRRAEDSGGQRDPAGPAAGGDGRALHVPQHEGVQAAPARQGLPHRKVSVARDKRLSQPLPRNLIYTFQRL